MQFKVQDPDTWHRVFKILPVRIGDTKYALHALERKRQQTDSGVCWTYRPVEEAPPASQHEALRRMASRSRIALKWDIPNKLHWNRTFKWLPIRIDSTVYMMCPMEVRWSSKTGKSDRRYRPIQIQPAA